MKCKLCKDNNASSIASHIFTHSFIKPMINPVDESRRGYGTSLKLSSSKFLEIFFERRVNNERVNEVLGRELTDEEIDNLVDHYAVKYILCTTCESKLERIENYFNENVFNDLFNLQIPREKTGNDQIVHTVEGVDNNIVRLFFYSMIWRASITTFADFKLKKKEEEKIRSLLNKCLQLDIQETINCANNFNVEIRSYPLMLFTTKFFCDITSNLIHIDKSKVPYFLCVNEYIIIFGAKPNHIKSSINHFYGLSEMINYSKSLNINEDFIKIIELPSKLWHNMKEEMFRVLAKAFLREIRIVFSEAQRRFYPNEPLGERLSRFIDDFVNEPIPAIKKYTLDNIQNKMIQHLS